MIAPEPARPADEHIDAVARLLWTPVHTDVGPRSMYFDECAAAILTSTDAAVHAALAASLPAEVMLAALGDRGVLRSPETAYPIAWTIHVEVPTAATKAEVDTLNDRIADAAYGMERGMWDPFVAAHTLDCVASDHCAAPRPNGPPYPKPEVAP